MYEHFYGFKRKPFQLLPNADFFFRSKKHDIALTYLEYGIYERAGFIVITGEIGTGKTTLLNYLLRTLNKDLPIIYISQTYLSPEDFLRIICQEFSLPYEGKRKSELIELFGEFLVDQFKKDRYVILILDEAQNLPLETLEEIRMLSNLDAGSENLLQIILVGQPSLREKLRGESLRQLAQRVEVSYHLGPLDRDEIGDYIRYRIERAEGTDKDLFSEEAIEEIYNYSKGIPRIINAVCHMCLVYGMADELRKIDRSLVLNVLKDRSDWDLIPTEKEETKKEIPSLPPTFFETKNLEELLRNIDVKIGSIAEVVGLLKMSLEQRDLLFSGREDKRENIDLKDIELIFKKYWDVFLRELGRIEETLALGLENQKRLINILSQRMNLAKNFSEKKKSNWFSLKYSILIGIGLFILLTLFIFLFFNYGF